MANNVPITPGSGASIATDEVTDATLGTVQVQYLKLMDGTNDGTNRAIVSSAGAVKVDNSAVTQPVSYGGGNFIVRINGGSGEQINFVGQNASGSISSQLAGGQFNTTPTTITNGNFSPLQLDSAANLLVNLKTALPTGANVIGAVTQSGTWSERVVGNNGGAFDFASTQNIAAPAQAILVGGEFNTTPTTITTGNASPLQLDNAGNLLVNIKASVAQQVTGDVANGSTDSGNPQKIGGLAKTANPTAVSDGQRVNGLFDKLGKQIAVGAIRDLKAVQTTSITAGTETTVVTAGAAGVFNDVYGIVVTNTSATGVSVAFKDATGGTTRVTIYAPATETRGLMLPVDSSMVQATAANNWTATVSTGVTSILITMLYVKNI